MPQVGQVSGFSCSIIYKLKSYLVHVDLYPGDTQLAKFEGEDQYICKVAKEPKQIAALIEAGFTYVCEKDGLLLSWLFTPFP